jgi:hypothetical protein
MTPTQALERVRMYFPLPYNVHLEADVWSFGSDAATKEPDFGFTVSVWVTGDEHHPRGDGKTLELAVANLIAQRTATGPADLKPAVANFFEACEAKPAPSKQLAIAARDEVPL